MVNEPSGSVLDEMTDEQIRQSARGWHEIADMVDAGADDQEIATVARATVYRDQYGVKPEGARLREDEEAPCGRIMVGSGTDTYDPTCDLMAGHSGSCKSRAAIDQHRLES